MGQWLRPRVWQLLGRAFQPGNHVLELACGTGEDAVWLAQRGVTVTATDGSGEMVRATAVKAQAAGLSSQITPLQISLQSLQASDFLTKSDASLFDGAYSNFGGLNVLSEWRTLAQTLATLIKPGGKVVLVPMGPFCPWEILWYALHGQWRNAVRRFRSPATATIGTATIPIWYPSARRLRQEFGPWFHPVQTQSLGFWLPPSYLSHLIRRWPRLFQTLHLLDEQTAVWLKGWGDHYILILERTPDEL